MNKIAIGASVIFALAATPALAKTYHSRTVANQAYGATENGSVTADESGLPGHSPVSFDQARSWDPDPNIRLQLMRDSTLPN